MTARTKRVAKRLNNKRAAYNQGRTITHSRLFAFAAAFIPSGRSASGKIFAPAKLCFWFRSNSSWSKCVTRRGHKFRLRRATIRPAQLLLDNKQAQSRHLLDTRDQGSVMYKWYVSKLRKAAAARDPQVIWDSEEFVSELEARAFASAILAQEQRVEAGTLPGVCPPARISWREVSRWAQTQDAY